MAVDLAALDGGGLRSRDPFDLTLYARLIPFRTRDGAEHFLPSDPDVEVVERMLELEPILKQDVADPSMPIARAIIEGKRLLLELCREAEPELDDLKVGVGDVLVLFQLITGGESVAHAVAETLVEGMGPTLTPEEAQERREKAAAGGPDAPLPTPSASRSRGRSSRSGAGTRGRRGTGATG